MSPEEFLLVICFWLAAGIMVLWGRAIRQENQLNILRLHASWSIGHINQLVERLNQIQASLPSPGVDDADRWKLGEIEDPE